MYELLKEQMHSFYNRLNDPLNNVDFIAVSGKIDRDMEAIYSSDPEAPAVLLKSRLHEAIAEYFQPVVFTESPFYYEMGLRSSKNWGTPESFFPSCWLLGKRIDSIHTPLLQNIESFERGGVGMTGWNSVFDADHHCIGYTEIFAVGVNGILDRIRTEGAGAGGEKQIFCQAAEKSCRALLKIADKFSLKAEEMLKTDNLSERQRKFLSMTADTARRIPAEPPRTFYEGLAALWFLREAVATLEGIGISVVGHMDRLLGPLYETDLQSGRITEREARELLAIWMMPTDIKFDLMNSNWPETSTCAELGGCDAQGNTVWNAVTRMMMEVHEEQGLLNPKLNCRFSSDSPQAYLEAIGRSILRGHNNYTLLNDDVLIPAIRRTGKTVEEARLYVNGGCQETITEGVEHSAGAFYYFSMPRVLDICLLGKPSLPEEVCGPDTISALPERIDAAATYDEFYRQLFEGLKKSITAGAEWRRILGERWRDIHPCPLFSATLKGCIESGRDYTAGGAKYNPNTLCAFGLATVIDSLYVIKKAVYEEKLLTLEELRGVLQNNWENNEPLRQRFISYPKFGHGLEETDSMASEFMQELSEFVRTLINERGGRYQPSMFVYYAFEQFSHHVRATPDGRKRGDLLSQGIAPYRLNPVKSVTDSIRSLSKIDFTNLAGNSVLDAQLPIGSKLDVADLTGLFRGFAAMGGPTLQPNAVSLEDMIDAKKNPENHRDLVVRICGLSAYFVALTSEVQDEIISRNMYES